MISYKSIYSSNYQWDEGNLLDVAKPTIKDSKVRISVNLANLQRRNTIDTGTLQILVKQQGETLEKE